MNVTVEYIFVVVLLRMKTRQTKSSENDLRFEFGRVEPEQQKPKSNGNEDRLRVSITLSCVASSQ